MSSAADLPYEIIDIIFEFIPSNGLHVSRSHDATSLVLDAYSDPKHFFLKVRRHGAIIDGNNDIPLDDILRNMDDKPSNVGSIMMHISVAEIVKAVILQKIDCPDYINFGQPIVRRYFTKVCDIKKYAMYNPEIKEIMRRDPRNDAEFVIQMFMNSQ